MCEPREQLNIFDALSMDSDSQYILRLIRNRSGKQSAISVDTIANITGIGGRTVRDIVKNLIEHHHIRIGSSLGNPSGYYMIVTDEEAEENERTLRKLGVSILTRAAVLKGLKIRDYMKKVQTDLPL